MVVKGMKIKHKYLLHLANALLLTLVFSGAVQAQLDLYLYEATLDGDSVRVLFRAGCLKIGEVEAHEITLRENSNPIAAFNVQYYDTVPPPVSVAVVVNCPSASQQSDRTEIIAQLSDLIQLKQGQISDFTVFSAHSVIPGVTSYNGDSSQFVNDLTANIAFGDSYYFNAVDAAVQHLASQETVRRYLFVINTAFDDGNTAAVDSIFRDIHNYNIKCLFGNLNSFMIRLQDTWLASHTKGTVLNLYSPTQLSMLMDQYLHSALSEQNMNILTYERMSPDDGSVNQVELTVNKCNTSRTGQRNYTTVDRTQLVDRNPIALYVEVPNKISDQEYELPIYIDDPNIERKLRESLFVLVEFDDSNVLANNIRTSLSGPRTLLNGSNQSSGSFDNYTAISLNNTSDDTTASVLAFLRMNVTGSIVPGVPLIERFVIYSSDGRHIWNANMFEINTSQGFRIFPNISLPTCETREVTITAEPGYTEYFWSTGEEGESIEVNEQGPVFCYVFDQHGVKRYSDTVLVTYRTPPEPFLNLANDTLVCGDGSILLWTTEPFFQYHWSTGELGRSIEVRKGAEYWVEVTDQLGCKGRTSSINIQVKEKPTIVLYSFPGLQVCEPDVVQLQVFAHDAVAYTWSTSAVGDQLEVFESGDYYAIVTDINGCNYNSDTIHVDILEKPDALIIGEPSACYNTVQSYSVDSANPGHDYIWSAIGGIVIEGQGMPQASILWLNASFGTVKVKEDNGSCQTQSTKDIILQPFEIPLIEILGSTELCAGDTVLLRSTKEYDHYYWSNGSTERAIRVSRAGAYSVSIENDGGCQGASDPIIVTMHAKPQTPVISLSGTTLQAPAATEYFWYLDDSLLSAEKGRILQLQKNGVYKLAVVNQYGCRAESEDFEVSVIGIETPENPGAFSVTIYPTTTPDIVNILLSVSHLTDVDIMVFDMLGRLKHSQTLSERRGEHPIPMNIRHLESGLYYIVVKTHRDEVTQTVMKKRE
jgi:type IX secretion system substrate protein/PKD domain-containing protein